MKIPNQVESWQDQRADGGSVVVTLKHGWSFQSTGHCTSGIFTTSYQAREAVKLKNIHRCTCEKCNGNKGKTAKEVINQSNYQQEIESGRLYDGEIDGWPVSFIATHFGGQGWDLHLTPYAGDNDESAPDEVQAKCDSIGRDFRNTVEIRSALKRVGFINQSDESKGAML